MVLTGGLAGVFSAFLLGSLPSMAVPFSKAISDFQSLKGVEIEFEKTTESEILKTKKSQKGELFLKKEKFRLESKSPDKTILVFDGRHIWNVAFPPEEFGGDPEIQRLKLSKKNQNHLLLFQIFRGKIQGIYTENFDSEKNRIDLVAKKKGIKPEEIQILLDNKGSISSLIWKDDVGNQTEFKLVRTKVSEPLADSLFQFKPPKGSKVIDL